MLYKIFCLSTDTLPTHRMIEIGFYSLTPGRFRIAAFAYTPREEDLMQILMERNEVGKRLRRPLLTKTCKPHKAMQATLTLLPSN